VEIIYWGMVNPRINKVLVPVEPYFPDQTVMPYEWTVNDQGEQVNIKLVRTSGPDNTDASDPLHTVIIKQIHDALVDIGAKGIGEMTVKKIYYDKSHMNCVGAFFNIKKEDASVLGGGTASDNVYNAIHNALAKIKLPTLMAASKVFGRGLGVRKFEEVFKVYPDFINDPKTYKEYVTMLEKVPGFGDKTAKLAAEGMNEFWKFVGDHVSDQLMVTIVDNTFAPIDHPSGPLNPDINGKNICITGFRDAAMADFITRNGGKVQDNCTGTTHMVVRKNDSYSSKKTETAALKGLPILSRDDFTMRYGPF
jgi:hypothetical protein